MELKRLFDCIDYQLSKFPKADMLAAKVNGRWQSYSTAEVKETVNALSAGFLKKGYSGNDMTIDGADKIAIISNNCPEWIFTDIAVQQTGAILVPIYPTTNPIELEFILKDSAAKMIFVRDKELYEKVLTVSDRLPNLQNIYCFHEVEGVKNWKSLLANEPELLQKVSDIKATISPKHVATIIYT
ncbi:MAG TPA: AMP-binding protein, partial [Segetibacter sp.]|nr:AMP-binding protein [Segetibacter sp.]